MTDAAAPAPPESDPLAVLPAAADSSDPYARTAETFPRLSEEQTARVTSFGRVEDLAAGTVLFEINDRRVDFFLVLQGFIEIYETGADGEPQVMTVHAERQFTGELDLFNDRAILVSGRMGVGGRVARLDRAQFRRMLAAEPDIAETVMRAFILRRAGFISHGQAAVTVIGSRRDADMLRIQRFLTRNGHPFLAVDPDLDEEAAALLDRRGVRVTDLPVVLCGHSSVLVRPSNGELGSCLGISEPLDPATSPTWSWWAPAPPISRRRSMPLQKASTPWCWKPKHRAARPVRALGSRTIWASPPGSPDSSWPGERRSRPRSSAPE